MLHLECKERLLGEHMRWVKKCLRSKLNRGNMVRGINTWGESLMRYCACIVDWTKAELEEINGKNGKMMTMCSVLPPGLMFVDCIF